MAPMRRRTVLALAVLLAAAAVPAQSAQAQPAPAPSGAAGSPGASEALVPPRPVTPLTAAYPEGAQAPSARSSPTAASTSSPAPSPRPPCRSPAGGDFTDAFRLRSLGQSVGAEVSLHHVASVEGGEGGF